MTVLEYMPVSRRVQILDESGNGIAFEKENPSFRITSILIGLVILYALSLPLSYT